MLFKFCPIITNSLTGDKMRERDIIIIRGSFNILDEIQ